MVLVIVILKEEIAKNYILGNKLWNNMFRKKIILK